MPLRAYNAMKVPMTASPASAPAPAVDFDSLGLPENMLATVRAKGYTIPSPIQAATIPALLEGRDVLGQAQTGTGKTAAFALPLLARLDTSIPVTQVLVLAPTRELAIQVAESFSEYGAGLRGLRVTCLYGGASYIPQLRDLQRGAHVVVGTPGRLIDHLDRGTLKLDQLRALVLDEADEMLRMGFIEDVARIASACPKERQTTLFSATLPPPIRALARSHTRDPLEISIAASGEKPLIRQCAAIVPYRDKIDALLRLLSFEDTDGIIVFVATKVATNEVAEALVSHGHRAAMLSGDVAQRDREHTVSRFIKGDIDILVATDVAARGLDVDRVSHVVNFDLPPDIETYTHRIGRTGRAGRTGTAIAFANPNQRYLLNNLVRRAGMDIERWDKPSAESVNQARLKRFGKRLVLEHERRTDLEAYRTLIEEIESAHGISASELAATLARLVNGDAQPFRDQKQPIDRRPVARETHRRDNHPPAKFAKRHAADRQPSAPKAAPPKRTDTFNAGTLYTLAVGYKHGANPSRVLATVAGATGLEGRAIGRIAIGETETVIETASPLDRRALSALAKARINGQALSPDRQPL
ncbi:MAG: DEAD/DEAH box helicase [Planctomycetota bacterium]|nr:MAG: DEAD/DEAH box helicase [Planctomycetota bacterium]